MTDKEKLEKMYKAVHEARNIITDLYYDKETGELRDKPHEILYGRLGQMDYILRQGYCDHETSLEYKPKKLEEL